MDDLISRKDAIDALEREKTYCTAFRDGYTPINVFEKYNAGITDGIKALKNLPSAQRWIPVTERLPEDDVQVLCTDSEGFVYIAWHCDYDILEKTKCWCDVHYCSLPEDDIIAWMPLPEPYAERREE